MNELRATVSPSFSLSLSQFQFQPLFKYSSSVLECHCFLSPCVSIHSLGYFERGREREKGEDSEKRGRENGFLSNLHSSPHCNLLPSLSFQRVTISLRHPFVPFPNSLYLSFSLPLSFTIPRFSPRERERNRKREAPHLVLLFRR